MLLLLGGVFMRVTFPHMGNLYVALEGIFTYLGVEVCLPPKTNKETINIGTRSTPEAACLPFKIVLGNFIQGIEKGADTVIMLGGNGPCRFGYYGPLAEKIMQDLGYKFNLIMLEGNNFFDLINKIRVESGVSYWQILEAIRFGWVKLKTIDDFEKLTVKSRPREKLSGAISRIFDEAVVLIRGAKNLKEINLVKKSFFTEVKKLTLEKEVLKVGLVGDIYMMLEPAANFRVEKMLGALGVEVQRSIYVSDWLKHNLLPHIRYTYKKRLLGAGYPYLKAFVGGHGLDTVANSVIYAQKKFDGVIQILPMTCMPEIVAQSVLPKVQRDHGIPVLTLVLDEHGGEAGFATRIEAFVDLLHKRKEKNVG